MLTFKNLLDFVLENKKDKTFFNMTEIHIINLLQQCLQNGTLLYHVNNNGDIDGMIIAEVRPQEKVLFVTENLSMNLSNLKDFALEAKKKWPHYTLQWFKHNKHKHPNTKRLYEKFLNS